VICKNPPPHTASTHPHSNGKKYTTSDCLKGRVSGPMYTKTGLIVLGKNLEVKWANEIYAYT
jgi:hypothetical protein